MANRTKPGGDRWPGLAAGLPSLTMPQNIVGFVLALFDTLVLLVAWPSGNNVT